MGKHPKGSRENETETVRATASREVSSGVSWAVGSVDSHSGVMGSGDSRSGASEISLMMMGHLIRGLGVLALFLMKMGAWVNGLGVLVCGLGVTSESFV